MKKFLIQFIFLTAVALGALYVAFNPSILDNVLPTNSSYVTQNVKINNTVISVELADTTKKRTVGLGGKDSLDENSGMLFIFSEAKKNSFWMKGMKFPLDMIFIASGKVVDILKNIPAPEINTSDQDLPVYQPVVPIDMLLEVNSGFADRNQIHVGDSVFRL